MLDAFHDRLSDTSGLAYLVDGEPRLGAGVGKGLTDGHECASERTDTRRESQESKGGRIGVFPCRTPARGAEIRTDRERDANRHQ
ncbi:hypothetical protein GCM10023205_65050 [Yinghuangia aomiensis]|uniref:Uncharacterized protein n=1 Tax=Yinghuangia aomiensis TaxID=676205 RepID=A0ABP9I1Y9_9ACTN